MSTDRPVCRCVFVPVCTSPVRGDSGSDHLLYAFRFDSDVGQKLRAQSAQLSHRVTSVPCVAKCAQGTLDSRERGLAVPREPRTKVAGARRTLVEPEVPARSNDRLRSREFGREATGFECAG